MGFIIIWSNFAEIQLDKIFHYYKDVAGSAIAMKILKEIILAIRKSFYSIVGLFNIDIRI